MSARARPDDCVLSLKIEPKTKADEAKMRATLDQMVADDPTLHVAVDSESHETILSGTSESHLDSKIELLLRTGGFGANFGPLVIAYRETIDRAVTSEFTFDKSIKMARQFAFVKLDLVPIEGVATTFSSDVAEQPPFDTYVRAVEAGVRQVWEQGVLLGYPLVGLHVTLIEAIASPTSTPIAFDVAAREAMNTGCKNARITLLEPVMTVCIRIPRDVPAAITHNVIRDLGQRHGSVISLEHHTLETLITAFVPISQMFGYETSLAALSGGRASHTQAFSHYGRAPYDPSPDDPETFLPAIGMRA